MDKLYHNSIPTYRGCLTGLCIVKFRPQNPKLDSIQPIWKQDVMVLAPLGQALFSCSFLVLPKKAKQDSNQQTLGYPLFFSSDLFGSCSFLFGFVTVIPPLFCQPDCNQF